MKNSGNCRWRIAMNTRIKAGVVILAAIGAVSSVQFISGSAKAQQPPPPAQGGLGGGGFGGGGQRRMGPMNATAKVTIEDAIKTATGKTPGYVNSATLRPGPGGVPGQPPKLIWVLHIVTTPGAGPQQPGKGENVAVDAEDNKVVDMPPPPQGFGGGGGFGGGRPPGGGQGGPPPPPPGGGQ
jgi:hypothetical protein